MSFPIKSTIDALLDNNYREYFFFERDSSQYKSCDHFFQKRVINREGGLKYFINVYIYDFSKYNATVLSTVEVDFDDNCNRRIKISLSGDDFESIQDCEDYMENLFIKNNFVNDIHNDQ